MKKLLTLAALTLSTLALASTWEIDSDHAQAGFSVRHMMVSNVKGHLGTVTGKVELDEKDLTKSKVEVSIDVARLSTAVAKRDTHLRSDAFFDVAKFPAVTFKSTKIEKGDKLKVTGDLTMHGVTKPVTLEAELSDEVVNPFSQVPARSVRATATINREDWGLTWNKQVGTTGVLVSKEVKLDLEIELSKVVAPAPKK